ncbi:MAG TPA: hypothetical protein VEJ47_14860 [Candidatus Eremiobacteraceae bacterium]|nr:hypothetical protein [Candidatus Eremiobacteraceae bacterium]
MNHKQASVIKTFGLEKEREFTRRVWSRSLQVIHSPNMSRVYGTLTGFIVVMLGIYLVTLSILLGAQADAAMIAWREVTP